MQAALPMGSGLTNEEKGKLWAAADKLRGHLDAAEYKHVVLGLIFLKYISDAFEEHYAELEQQRGEGIDPEDKDEYTAEGIFWVPPEARWSTGRWRRWSGRTRRCATCCRRGTRGRRSTRRAWAG